MGKYRSPFDLPMPPGWNRRAFYGYGYAIVTLATALFVLVILGGSVAAIVSFGERPPAAITVGLLPMLAAISGGLLFNGWVLWPRTAPVAARLIATDGSPALVLPVRLGSTLGPLAAVVGGLYLIGLGVFALIRMFEANPQTGFLLFALLAAIGGGAIFLAYLSYTAGITKGDTGIRLTEQHITTEFGGGPTTVSWHDIAAIRAGSETGRSNLIANPRTNTIAILLSNPPTAADQLAYEITHKQLDTDPTLVYHLLQFYLHNPAHRGELSTAAALNRFHAGDYPADPTVAKA